MSLQDAIKFLKGAVARNLPGRAPGLYIFHEGWCYAQNTAVIAAYPVPHILGTFALAADGLEAALSRFDGEPVISAGDNDGVIAMKSGRIRSSLKLMHADPPASTMPTESWEPIPQTLAKALRMTAVFVSDSGTWQQGVKLATNVVAAINNKNAIEIEVAGLTINGTILMSNDCIGYLDGVNDPDYMSFNPSSICFRWMNDAWIRCQLLVYEWLDIADKAIEEVGDVAPIVINDEWREAFADAAALGEANGSVEVTPTGLISRSEHATTNIDLGTGVETTTKWAFDALTPVIKIADRWNPDVPGGKARFYGPNLRGVVAGVDRAR